MSANPAAPVVVGVDGSTEGMQALDWAVEAARRYHRPLRIVHALDWPLLTTPLANAPYAPPDDGLREAAESILADARRRVGTDQPDLAVETDLSYASAGAALVDASREAAMVVVGSRGLGGFAGLLLGSVGAQLTAHSAAPAVVVRYAPDFRPPGDRVVVGVDGAPSGENVLGFAFEEASMRGVPLVAVHAWTGPVPTGPGDMLPLVYDVDAIRGEEERLLAEALSGWRDRFPDVPVRSKLVHGRAAHTLVAESANAALLVVGARGHGWLPAIRLGSVSHAVLHHAVCPVAVTPVPRD